MHESRQARMLSIQAISSVVVAASVVALVRHQRHANISAKSPTSTSQPDLSVAADDIHEHPDDVDPEDAHPTREPLRRRILRYAINGSVPLAASLVAVRFGSVGSPRGLTVISVAMTIYFSWIMLEWGNWREFFRALFGMIAVAATVGWAVHAIASEDDLDRRVFLLFLVMALGGLGFWLREWKMNGSRANLGAALLGGVVVAATVFYVQVALTAGSATRICGSP